MQIIDGTDLASFPGVDKSLTSDQLTWIANRVNELVGDAWQCEGPIPTWVRTIALNAAGRFAQNPLGLESYTTSVDDGSHTRRLRGNGAPGGIYLTDDERAALGCGDVPSSVGTVWTSPTRPPRLGGRYAR